MLVKNCGSSNIVKCIYQVEMFRFMQLIFKYETVFFGEKCY